MKRPPTECAEPQAETHAYDFSFHYPLPIAQEDLTSSRAPRVEGNTGRIDRPSSGVSADMPHVRDHDHASPNNGEKQTLVGEQSSNDTVSRSYNLDSSTN